MYSYKRSGLCISHELWRKRGAPMLSVVNLMIQKTTTRFHVSSSNSGNTEKAEQSNMIKHFFRDVLLKFSFRAQTVISSNLTFSFFFFLYRSRKSTKSAILKMYFKSRHIILKSALVFREHLTIISQY